jgi:hypothetical protein
MRNVTLTGDWIMQYPEKQRAEIMKNLFSLADQYDYAIRMAGQYWAE